MTNRAATSLPKLSSGYSGIPTTDPLTGPALSAGAVSA
jgi:hypothetical protein